MNVHGRKRRKRNGCTIGRLERLECRELLSSVTEFNLAAGSGPYGITSGPDGALWFTETVTNKIGRITTDGTVTEFSIPTPNSNPESITTGSDGALWFTENSSSKIGRLTTSGSFTEYSLAAGSHPLEITSGPNGNLWFTENGTNKIGEIVPAGIFAGTITEFSLAASSSPWGITSGPNGNVWFTENGSDKVAEIIPSGPLAGTISEFSLSSGAGPRDITTGPDDNLWFIEEGGTNIGRVTAGGSVTEFATPDGDHPNGIVSGPGGDLYYTPFYTDDIGAVSTDGVFTSYGIPTSISRTIGITVGPDDHIWFAEANASKIGRLNLDPVASDDSYSYQKNTELTVSAAEGVLANDTDPEGDPLSVAIEWTGGRATAHGFVNLASDGSFAYMPQEGYIGPDSFDYQATDGSDKGREVTVHLMASIASTSLTVSTATGVYGGTTTVQAHLTSGGNDVAGELVDFNLGSVDLGTAMTGANGIASIPNVPITTYHAGNLVGAVTASFAGDSDYDVSGGSADLDVSPAPLTITAKNQTKIYGAALPTLTASYSGFVNGDTVASLTASPTITTAATAGSHVAGSPYAITASGAVDPDYTITYVHGSLTVTPAPLTITANNQIKIYGLALPPLTASYSGFVNGDTVASLTVPPALSTSATKFSDVGHYSINVGGGSSSDYRIVYVPSTLTVTPAMLTVQVANQSKVYGQPNPVLTGSVSGIVNGDNAGVNYWTAATTNSHVVNGGYAITATGLAGPKATDYTIKTVIPGTLTIRPAALTIKAANATKVYGRPNPSFTATYLGLVPGDSASVLSGSLKLNTSATAASHVGSYAVTPSGLTSSDYAITNAGGTLSVTPAPLTVMAMNAIKYFGNPVPTLTAVYSGFVNGDTAASLNTPVNLTTTATATSHIGYYSIMASGATSKDYTISYVPGVLANLPDPGQAAYINSLYNLILGRNAELAGYESWMTLLDNGVSRLTVAQMIYNSTEALIARALHRVRPIVGLWVAYTVALQAEALASR